MNDRNRKVKLNKKSMVMIGAAFLIVLAVAALMYYMDHRSTGTSEGSGKKVYTIDGEECYKKQNIETYLFLGVDAAGDSRNTKQKKNQSVQCDSVILLVIDRVNKNFAILPLDRDAMVSLEIPDEDGNILGENTMQLALAYAYGDGKEQSCELAEDAVSGLLHDQRIDGYVSLSMDAIGAVNHLVGGVDVTVTDDFAGESGLASGQTVHLSDAQAETFVRGRKSVGDGTNENRMNRQQTYIEALYPAVIDHAKQDNNFVSNARKKLDKYMVTNMTDSDFSKIIEALSSDKRINVSDIKYSRTINKDTGYAEVEYDEGSLESVIKKLFYEPVEEWPDDSDEE